MGKNIEFEVSPENGYQDLSKAYANRDRRRQVLSPLFNEEGNTRLLNLEEGAEAGFLIDARTVATFDEVFR